MHTEAGEPFYLNGPIDVVQRCFRNNALYKDCQYHTQMLYLKSLRLFSLEYFLYMCITHSKMWEADKWNMEAAYQAVTILYKGMVIYVNDFIELYNDNLGSGQLKYSDITLM